MTQAVRTRAHGRRSGRARYGRIWVALAVLALAALAVVLVGIFVQDGLPGRAGALLYPLQYQDEISLASRAHGVDPYLVAAMVKAESNFDPTARSRVGAAGLMQLMPETAAWIVSRPDWEGTADPDLTDPGTNLDLGAYYLSYLLGRFHGGIVETLAAYNAGEGTVSRWLERRQQTNPGAGSLAVAEIPFPETRTFVERVQRYQALYKKHHPDAFTG
jgi:soluble lytic murein transglycosylase